MYKGNKYFRCIDPDNNAIDWKDCYQFIIHLLIMVQHEKERFNASEISQCRRYNTLITKKYHAFSILQGLIVFKILAQLKQNTHTKKKYSPQLLEYRLF